MHTVFYCECKMPMIAQRRYETNVLSYACQNPACAHHNVQYEGPTFDLLRMDRSIAPAKIPVEVQ